MFHVLPAQVVIVGFLGLLAWAACNDAVEFEIPDRASLGIVLLYPLFVAVYPLPINWLGALAVAGAIFVASFALFLAGRFGGGDVKLLTATALWAGPSLIISMLVVMAITGGALAMLVWVVQLLRRYRPASYGDVSLTTAAYAVPNRLPYGVAIAAGAGVIGLSMASG